MNRSARPEIVSDSPSSKVVANDLRHVPSVDRLLSDPLAAPLLAAHGRTSTVAAIRAVLSRWREALATAASSEAAVSSETAVSAETASTTKSTVREAPSTAQWFEQVERELDQQATSRLRPVFNLSGTVLHTNLGRALLPVEALDAMRRAACEPVNLEYDLEAGARGDRDDLIEPLLQALTGAEAATVVNNNAAAVLLCLSALAGGRQAIVSRGELVEIGGAFRIPDIMRRAQVRLVEVGTTNRTRVADFEQAIGPKTAMLMRVHASNYQIVGFTEAPATSALAELAHSRGLPLVEDLGSGALVDLTAYGLPREPVVAESIRQGVDIVTFSGDKLLGGPQAGIIVGRRELVARIKRDPLKRALRVDKVTLAALEAVLQLYRDPDRLAQRLPTLRLLSRAATDIEPVARHLAGHLLARLDGQSWRVSVEACSSMVGSGSQPVERLESFAVVIRAAGRASGTRLRALERAFRSLSRPIIGRVQEQALWLDCRMVDEVAPLLEAIDGLRP